MSHTNAILATASFDRIRGSASAPTDQPYNKFRVVTDGQPLVQGQIATIGVSEVMFPYDIPTIVSGYNDAMTVTAYEIDGVTGTVSSGGTVLIQIPGQYYTATAMTAVVNAFLTSPIMSDLELVYNPVLQSFRFQNNATWNPAGFNTVYVIETSPFIAPTTANRFSRPELLWTLGFRSLFAHYPAVPVAGQTPAGTIPPSGLVLVPADYPNVAPYPIFATDYSPTRIIGAMYSGSYTDYIDICSPSLAQAQYVRDGNTNQYVVRRDLLCRLYVANDNSVSAVESYSLGGTAQGTQIPIPGQRPFVIHRQFTNPKVMRWTVDRAVDAIDIALFDQYGLPLPTDIERYNVNGDPDQGYFLTSPPRDFALTLLVKENDA